MQWALPFRRRLALAALIIVLGFGQAVPDLARLAVAWPANQPSHLGTFATAAGHTDLLQILKNNGVASANLWLGWITLCVVTVRQLLRVGLDLAHGVAAIWGIGGGTTHVFAGLLPHGVFEISAFCIAGAAGLGNGLALWFLAKGDLPLGAGLFRQSVRAGVACALLLLLAAAIETYITPWIFLKVPR